MTRNKLSLKAVFLLGAALFAGAAFAQGAAPVAASAAASVAEAPKTDTGNAIAAFYSNRFAGRKTACKGGRYSPAAMTAASNTFSCGAKVKVTNLSNKRTAVVTINDRMPANSKVSIDLSRAAAKKLNFIKSGTTAVSLEQVGGKK